MMTFSYLVYVNCRI